ncbi:alpha/beta fold hydrolase [Actinomycetospora termitidis]|uniref:Alpha/beta fold hydrolase n=1 Tax=Actinomycetospora termitidis TaxID=3053470 RepID=A0ABT7M7K5_9PSEU|nr:alpha/beta fold hydrolase [Actinomycetospora sp. Odt1-22]MDL5156179.1 alpha/beta fold hydrolase [Actinomycetospora sp. Odt1-22]
METVRLTEAFDFRGDAVAWGAIGAGDPLVLVHGTPFSSVVWRRIAPHLARHRRVYAFDLVGYGRSAKHEGQDVSLGVQPKLFAALLDHWGVDRPDVVAHDFGGATALRAHLLGGRDYRTLTLIDPVALSPHGSALVQAARRHATAYSELPDYVHQAVLRAYVAGAVHRTLSPAEMDAYVAPWTGEEGKPAFYRQIAQMSDRYTDEIQDRYDEMRVAPRILWGAQDGWIPVDRAYELAARMPRAELRVVEDAGHLVQEDRPEAVVAAVLDLLDPEV